MSFSKKLENAMASMRFGYGSEGLVKGTLDASISSPPVGTPFADWHNPILSKVFNCFLFAADALCDGLVDTVQEQLDLGLLVRVYIPSIGTGKLGDIFSKGRSFGKRSMKATLKRSGFIPLPDTKQEKITIPEGDYLIASYLSDRGFHFYRFHEESKQWYHKPGWFGVPTNLDEKGKVISNLDKADHGEYHTFVGYFLSPSNRERPRIYVEDYDGKVIFDSKKPSRESSPSGGQYARRHLMPDVR